MSYSIFDGEDHVGQKPILYLEIMWWVDLKVVSVPGDDGWRVTFELNLNPESEITSSMGMFQSRHNFC